VGARAEGKYIERGATRARTPHWCSTPHCPSRAGRSRCLRPLLLLCGRHCTCCVGHVGARGGKGGLYSYYGFELIYQYGTDISTLMVKLPRTQCSINVIVRRGQGSSRGRGSSTSSHICDPLRGSQCFQHIAQVSCSPAPRTSMCMCSDARPVAVRESALAESWKGVCTSTYPCGVR
jgi:hypothetical protein